MYAITEPFNLLSSTHPKANLINKDGAFSLEPSHIYSSQSYI